MQKSLGRLFDVVEKHIFDWSTAVELDCGHTVLFSQK